MFGIPGVVDGQRARYMQMDPSAARGAAASHVEHILQANERAGTAVDVFSHHWYKAAADDDDDDQDQDHERDRDRDHDHDPWFKTTAQMAREGERKRERERERESFGGILSTSYGDALKGFRGDELTALRPVPSQVRTKY